MRYGINPNRRDTANPTTAHEEQLVSASNKAFREEAERGSAALLAALMAYARRL